MKTPYDFRRHRQHGLGVGSTFRARFTTAKEIAHLIGRRLRPCATMASSFPPSFSSTLATTSVRSRRIEADTGRLTLRLCTDQRRRALS